MDAASEEYDWPKLEERAAAGICYTSGTTGNPKGVVYTHRSITLHSYAVSLPTSLGLTAEDTVLLVVPMFHVNGWGIPYASAITGCRLVLPGPRLDGPALTGLMNGEAVTYYAGVPTVHMALLEHWKATGETVQSLRMVVSGGSALNRALMEGYWALGVDVAQGWGMTETSPVVTLSRLTSAQKKLPLEERAQILARQGKPLFGTELRIVDEEGRRLPEDGDAVGEVQVRGPWIASAYLGEAPGARLVDGGWFPTGDVGKILPDGTLHLTDRLKDLIKSGGEWISSIDLEDLVMRHPEIAMAAVIGIPSKQWDERPLLIAVPAPGASPSKASILEFLEGQVAKWWLPDDVIFVEELPLGATGKVQKAKLRAEYGGA
jgi:fatty-acyl-CoA synthase